jgi:hypothetical protein
MKAFFAVWLSVAVAPISLTSSFVPSSRFANPGPLLTKRVTPFFSTPENAPTPEAKKKDSPGKPLISVLLQVAGVLVKSRFNDLNDALPYDTYGRHGEVSKTSSSR